MAFQLPIQLNLIQSNESNQIESSPSIYLSLVTHEIPQEATKLRQSPQEPLLAYELMRAHEGLREPTRATHHVDRLLGFFVLALEIFNWRLANFRVFSHLEHQWHVLVNLSLLLTFDEIKLASFPYHPVLRMITRFSSHPLNQSRSLYQLLCSHRERINIISARYLINRQPNRFKRI